MNASLAPAGIKKLSRRLNQALRHQPEALGLQLSDQGWIAIDSLLHALWTLEGLRITPEMLSIVVEENDKKRLTISEDGLRIRSAQGHTTSQVNMVLPCIAPPDCLYHGTNGGALESIFEHGLRAGERHHVHLSADMATAVAVGSRHAKKSSDSVVVLQVATNAMAAAGLKFYQADNAVWLTDAVPACYLEIVC